MHHYATEALFCVFAFFVGVALRKDIALGGLALTLPLAGVLLYGAFSTSIPSESELTAIRGRIIANNSSPRRTRLEFRMEGVPHGLDYMNWWPAYERVVSVFRPGEEVVVWFSGLNRGEKIPPDIWRIDKGSETIVSYDDLARAKGPNKPAFLAFTALCVLVSVVATIHLLERRRRPSVPPPLRGGSV